MAGEFHYLDALGFWSYARDDEAANRGKLGQFRELLASELRSQLGEPVELYRDVGAIPYGAEWEREIRRAIGAASFFVPVITPRFLRSYWCNKEVGFFLDRQKAIVDQYGNAIDVSRIFPILYIDVENVDPISQENIDQIRKRQYLNFTRLRLKNYESEEAMVEISKLAGHICKLLRIKVPRPPTPEEIAEEQQRKQAGDEQRRIAETNRQAEEQRKRDALIATAARDAQIAQEVEKEKARLEQERLAQEAHLREEQSRIRLQEIEEARLKAEAEKRIAEAKAQALAEQRERWLKLIKLHGPKAAGVAVLVLVGSALLHLAPWQHGTPNVPIIAVTPSPAIVSPTASPLANPFVIPSPGLPSLFGEALLLKISCDSGKASDCTNLGYDYQTGGAGVKNDIATAADFYSKGCSGGSMTGCFDLGTQYDTGMPEMNGRIKDGERAAALYEQACNGNEFSGCYNLAFIYDPDKPKNTGRIKDAAKAAALYKQSCDGGNVSGCTSLGVDYEFGEGGLEKDLKRARELYDQACNKGEKTGCSNRDSLDKRVQ